MLSKAVSQNLMWDLSRCDAVDDRQLWVLKAIQRHGQELITMLWRILGNEQDVCDAYQNTFLQLAHYQSGARPRRIKAYVFRTAGNVAITMLRRRAAEKRRFAVLGCEPKSVESPLKELDTRDLQQQVRLCITRLPEHLRNVIALRDLAEMSYAQVARTLGISTATARVYRCKAIQMLALWMSQKSENENERY